MTIGTLAARIMADASGIKTGMGLTRNELKITRQAFLDSASDIDKHNVAIQQVEDAYSRGAIGPEAYRRAIEQINKEFRDKAADEYADKLKSIGTTMRDTGAVVAASAGAIALGIGAIGKGFLDAYAESEQAESKLRAAMQANGTLFEFQINAYKDLATEIQRTTVIEDDAVIGMVQYAESLGASGKHAENAVKNAIGLSSALGIQEDAAMKMAVALEQGNTTLLQRYIPGLKAISDPAERAAYAQEMVAKMFGVAEAEAGTYAGAMAQLTNQIGAQKEEFGKIISEALTPWVQQAKEYVVSMGDMDDSTRKMIVTVGAVGAGFATTVAAAGTMVAAAGQLTIWYGALQSSAAGAAVAQFGLGAAIGATSVAAGAVAFGAGYAFGQWLYDLTPWGETANRVLQDVHDSIQAIANIDMSGSTQEGLDEYIAATQRQIDKIEEHNQQLASQQAWYNGWQQNADIIAANNAQLDGLNANLNRAIQEQHALNVAQGEARGTKNAQALAEFEAAEARARRESAAATEEMRLQQEELRDLEQAAGNTANSFLTGLAPGVQAAMDEMDPFVKKMEQMNQTVDQTAAKLTEQIDTWGMSEEAQQAYRDAQEIARLSEMGASEEQLANVKELQDELARLKRQKDAMKEPAGGTSNTIAAMSLGGAFDIGRQEARPEVVNRFAGAGEITPAPTDPVVLGIWTQISEGINALVSKEGITVEEVSKA